MKYALQACELDNYCNMVYNENCDIAKQFTLCHKLEKVASSSTKSCIYMKSKTIAVTDLR